MTTPTRQPGEQRRQLDRPPSERFRQPVAAPAPDPLAGAVVPLGIALGGAIAFVVLGGILAVTAGLVIVAAVVGWLIGMTVSPPARAGLVGLGAVALGLLAMWLFGRIEGGVMDPLSYLLEVHGWPLVALQLLAGGGLAAAASR